MDVEKLIRRLRNDADAYRNGETIGRAFADQEDVLDNAATALSTLQAENEKLRSEAEGMRSNWYKSVEEIQKLRAELEQVRRERDAAQSLLAERIGVRGAEPITTAFGLSLDRLRELAQADREGRCVVLPAGIGDTVHHITTCKNFSQVLDGTMYGPNGELGTATGLYCPCELAETCPFPCDDDGSFDCEKHKNTLAIFEDVVTGFLSDDMQDTLFLEYSGNVAFDDFGKTVFLTREEAEAALRREQDG